MIVEIIMGHIGSGSARTVIDMENVTTPARIGSAIRRRRKALRMTQEDLAMSSGISAATVGAIENGKESARLGLVLQLCRDLGIRLRIEL